MEGIAGLVSGTQVSAGERDYAVGRRLMIAETNAAIAGAFDAGATGAKRRHSRATTASSAALMNSGAPSNS